MFYSVVLLTYIICIYICVIYLCDFLMTLWKVYVANFISLCFLQISFYSLLVFHLLCCYSLLLFISTSFSVSHTVRLHSPFDSIPVPHKFLQDIVSVFNLNCRRSIFQRFSIIPNGLSYPSHDCLARLLE